jgi:putative ABC transport system ATP-binding protein
MSSAAPAQPLVRATDVTRRLGRDPDGFTLGPVTLQIERATFTVLSGPSGSGKTTLLHLLAGLDRPDAGSLRLFGHDAGSASESALARVRRGHVSFVPQELVFLEHLPVWQNVTCRLVPIRRESGGRTSGERRARALELLARVGLEQVSERLPRELSGGERQRVALARALCVPPDLLVADEPTSQVDPRTAEWIARLLEEARAAGAAIVASLHDPRLQERADRHLVLSEGRFAAERAVPR